MLHHPPVIVLGNNVEWNQIFWPDRMRSCQYIVGLNLINCSTLYGQARRWCMLFSLIEQGERSQHGQNKRSILRVHILFQRWQLENILLHLNFPAWIQACCWTPPQMRQWHGHRQTTSYLRTKFSFYRFYSCYIDIVAFTLCHVWGRNDRFYRFCTSLSESSDSDSNSARDKRKRKMQCLWQAVTGSFVIPLAAVWCQWEQCDAKVIICRVRLDW